MEEGSVAHHRGRTILDYLGIVMKRRWTILVVLVAVVSLVALWTFTATPRPDLKDPPYQPVLIDTVRVGRMPGQADYIANYSSQALRGQSRTTEIYSPDGKQESIYSAITVRDAEGKITGAICLILPLDTLEKDFADIRATFYEAIALVALLGLLISFGLTFLISRRISEAKRMAEMVAEGDYHMRLEEKGPSEFRELAGHLNRMAEQLQEQTRQRQTLLANVTHELARPMGGLEIGIESLQGGAIKDRKLTNELLANMSDTLQRMEILLDDITLAAYPKAIAIELDIKKIDLNKFLRQQIARFRLRAEQLDIKLVTKLPKVTPIIYADEKRLGQILGNLIDNALKFTSRANRVVISARKKGRSQIQILVHDGGHGIAEQDIPHIFSPFYKGGTGRTIKQGMGLGLAIALQLAEIHGGTLELINAPSGGALAVLTLPLHAKPAG